MSMLSAGAARAKLFRLIDEVAENHRPLHVVGKRNTAVLVSEEDWSAIQETLYLLSVPGMRKSLLKGMRASHAKMSKNPGW